MKKQLMKKQYESKKVFKSFSKAAVSLGYRRDKALKLWDNPELDSKYKLIGVHYSADTHGYVAFAPRGLGTMPLVSLTIKEAKYWRNWQRQLQAIIKG